MGFLDFMNTFVDGTLDFIAELANTSAKRIDRMSDEEIENKYSHSSVYEVRNNADKAHMIYELRQSRKGDYDSYDDDYDDD